MGRSMKLAWLLLAIACAAAPLASASADTALSGEQSNCLADADLPGIGFFGYANADCKTCMEDAKVTNRWACGEQMCQNDDLWTADYPADTACVGCLENYDAAMCGTCFGEIPSGAPFAPAAADVEAARDQCIECATLGAPQGDGVAPYAGNVLPGWKDAGHASQYTWACSVCAGIPFSPEQAACYACISTTFALDPSEFGAYTTADDVDSEDWPYLNDFGKCASAWNYTYYVNNDPDAIPGGIFEMCTDLPSADAVLEVVDCVTCMNVAMDVDVQPGNTSKAYACASTCGLIPAAFGTGSDAADLADACTACVGDGDVYDAYGCKVCVDATIDPTRVAPFGTDECFACVQSNPYKEKIGSYNWACGECAKLADGTFQGMCEQCIKQPALDFDLESLSDEDFEALMGKELVGNISEIVCTCVDMFSSLTSNFEGELSDWYTQDCPNCTAMQRQCYLRKNVTAANGTYALFHVDDEATGDGGIGFGCQINAGEACAEECVACVESFVSAAGVLGGQAYACNSFCMNGLTMSRNDQVDDCFTCIEDRRAADRDVNYCNECINAFNGDSDYPAGTSEDQKVVLDTLSRSTCMGCLSFPILEEYKDTHDWACVECGKLSGEASTRCYECLFDSSDKGGILEPCQCVDGAKRGWLLYCNADADVSGGCLALESGGSPLFDELVANGTILVEGPVAVNSQEQCAEYAQRVGSIDGMFALTIDASGDAQCYYVAANYQYLLDVGLQAGTCDVTCPVFAAGAAAGRRSLLDVDDCGSTTSLRFFTMGEACEAVSN